MEDLIQHQLVEKIKIEKCVTFDTKEKYFKGKNIKEIRDWLEVNNMDRHLPIYIYIIYWNSNIDFITK